MAQEVLLPRQAPRTTRLLDEVPLMPTPYELEKVRLACFITELQDLIDGHNVSSDLKEPLKDVLDNAHIRLHVPEQDHGQ